MKHIKISFVTKDKKTGKTGLIYCSIFDGKAMYRFNNQNHAEITFKKMQKDGKKVFFSRGMIVQFFIKKSMEEIKEIIKKDINIGMEQTKQTDTEIIVEDYMEELIER